jgi:Lrp/AsnC family leucine-responsive transcriptional regulator
VQEVRDIAGEDCYVVDVRAANTKASGRRLRDRFGTIPSLRSTHTTIVLSTVKATAQLPLGSGAEESTHA